MFTLAVGIRSGGRTDIVHEQHCRSRLKVLSSYLTLCAMFISIEVLVSVCGLFHKLIPK